MLRIVSLSAYPAGYAVDRSCGRGGEGKGKEGGPPTHSATHTASLSDESWKGENGSGLTDAAGDKADPISSSFSDSNGFSLSLSLSLPSHFLPSLTFLRDGYAAG